MGREYGGDRRGYSAPGSAPRNSGMYMPSEEMGDYEQMREKRKPSGPLYPLDEEGTYGPPPSALPKPLPPYAKRERKPKAYASYAVSNECSMHVGKLEQNESVRGRTPPRRGKTPPTRKDSGPSRSQERAPSRPREPAPVQRRDSTRRESTGRRESTTRRESVARRESMSRRDSMKRESVSRDTAYTPGGKMNWQNSLRGASPSTPRIQRRPSTRSNSSTLPRQKRTSASPSRARTISTSPDRFRKQSMSPERGGGQRSSTDWGYTDFSTFTANRKNSDYSTTSNRKFSADRKASTTSSRKDSMMSTDYSRKNSGRDTYSSGRDNYSSGRDSFSSGRDLTSSGKDYTVSRADYTGSSSSSHYTKGSRSSSPTKIGLSALKTPVISEWDGMGVLGLSSKMFKESTSQQESYLSSSSFMRRESVTTKVM